MLYLLLDLPHHILARVRADPPRDQRVQIHRGKGIDIFPAKRAKVQPSSHDGKQDVASIDGRLSWMRRRSQR